MVFALVFKSILMQVVQKRVYVFLSPWMGWEVLWACVPVSAVPVPAPISFPTQWQETKVGPITRCSSQAAMMRQG